MHVYLKEKEFVVTPPELSVIILSFIQSYVRDFLKIKIHARLPKVREMYFLLDDLNNMTLGLLSVQSPGITYL